MKPAPTGLQPHRPRPATALGSTGRPFPRDPSGRPSRPGSHAQVAAADGALGTDLAVQAMAQTMHLANALRLQRAPRSLVREYSRALATILFARRARVASPPPGSSIGPHFAAHRRNGPDYALELVHPRAGPMVPDVRRCGV